MSYELPRCQQQALRRWVHRHIRRLLNDVEGFEMDPHGMSRIGQASMCKSICRQQITEFIMSIGLRNAELRKQPYAEAKNQQADAYDRKGLFPSQFS